jgi:HAD superfamily hydrolase (TIGR01509 family)
MPPSSSALGLIFDFDGVLALSEPVHAASWEDMAVQLGRSLPPGFLERGIGNTDRNLSFELAAHWGEGFDGEEVLETKRAFYRRRARQLAPLVPGVPQALRRYAGRFPMAVATSSTRGDLEPYFEASGIDRYFEAVLTIESVTRPKPDPEIYLAAAERLGLPPERCVVFEDSIHGARAARAARTRLVALTTTFSVEQLSPVDAHMPDFADLRLLDTWLERFEGLNSPTPTGA